MQEGGSDEGLILKGLMGLETAEDAEWIEKELRIKESAEEKVLTEKNYMWRLSQEFYECTVSVIFSMRCIVLLAVRNGHQLMLMYKAGTILRTTWTRTTLMALHAQNAHLNVIHVISLSQVSFLSIRRRALLYYRYEKKLHGRPQQKAEVYQRETIHVRACVRLFSFFDCDDFYRSICHLSSHSDLSIRRTYCGEGNAGHFQSQKSHGSRFNPQHSLGATR